MVIEKAAEATAAVVETVAVAVVVSSASGGKRLRGWRRRGGR